MNELKGGWNYGIGDYVNYRLKTTSSGLSYQLRKGYIKEICVRTKDNHKYYRITDDMFPYNATWAVEPEWILGYAVKKESSMCPSTIEGEFNKLEKELKKEYVKRYEESVKDFLNRIYVNPDFKPEVHSDAADSLAYSIIKRKSYGLNTDATFYDEFVNKEDNKMKNQQKKRNRNIIKTEKYSRIIKDITFNGPAVIVKFEPTCDDLCYGLTKGDKVVVVCKDGDKYDMKTGFLLAILKEFLNNQSYGNILEKLDSFNTFDIPQVGKDDVFKFKVGDIVRLKHGVARFKVDKCTTFTASSGKEVPRYRIVRLLGSKCSYSAYANENELVLADEVYHK